MKKTKMYGYDTDRVPASAKNIIMVYTDKTIGSHMATNDPHVKAALNVLVSRYEDSCSGLVVMPIVDPDTFNCDGVFVMHDHKINVDYRELAAHIEYTYITNRHDTTLIPV